MEVRSVRNHNHPAGLEGGPWTKLRIKQPLTSDHAPLSERKQRVHLAIRRSMEGGVAIGDYGNRVIQAVAAVHDSASHSGPLHYLTFQLPWMHKWLDRKSVV